MPAPNRPLPFYIAIGLIQGLLVVSLLSAKVYFLDFNLSIALCAMAAVVGINLQLLGGLRGQRGALWLVAGLGLLIGAISAVVLDVEHMAWMEQTWCLAAVLVGYIGTAFILAWPTREGLRPRYPALFQHAWNNAFIVLLALLLTGLFWLLVWLCAGLFNMVGIAQVRQAVTAPVFVWLVLPVVFSLGMRMGCENERIIGLLRGMLLALCRFLLPFSALSVVVFTLALPFTGLQADWGSGYFSSLLLVLAGINLFLLNGVFQDGQQGQVYAAPLKRLVEASLLCLPVLVGLAAYAMWMRIDQYGASPSLILALLLVAVMAAHSLAALWAVLAPRRGWLHSLQVSNPWIALLSALLLVSFYTPLLAPQAISARSQVERLLSGRTAVADFDVGNLYWRLGDPGRKAFDALDAQLEAGEVLDRKKREQLLEKFSMVRTPRHEEDLSTKVEWLGPVEPGGEAFDRMQATLQECGGKGCLLWGVDMDGDGRNEVLMIPRQVYASYVLLFARDGEWREVGSFSGRFEGTDELVRLIREGAMKPVTPRYKTFTLNGQDLTLGLEH